MGPIAAIVGPAPAPRRDRERAVVRQKDDRLLREALGERAVGGRVEVDPRGRRAVELVVQEAEFLLLVEHPQDRSVDEGDVDRAGLDRGLERLDVCVSGGKLDVDAREKRLRGGLAEVRGDPVEDVEERDAEVVGDDDAIEAPAVAEQAGEEVAVGRDGEPVDLDVGVHDAPRARVLHRHLKGRQHDVSEFAAPHAHRPEVAPCARGGVAHEVLERRVDARALEAANKGAAHGADEVGVLADAFVYASPARVTDDVENGREALMDPEGAHRLADGGGHLLDRFGVEGRAPRQGRGEGRGLPGRETRQALLVNDRRDSQPGLRDETPLELPEPCGALVGVVRARPVHPREVPQSVDAGVREEASAVADLALEGGDDVALLVLPEADELRELLVERHLVEQRRRPAGRRMRHRQS